MELRVATDLDIRLEIVQSYKPALNSTLLDKFTDPRIGTRLL